MRGVREEFAVDLVEVDLAGAEGQRAASVAEDDRAHAQDAFVEADGPIDVGDCQYQVVQAGDPDPRPRVEGVAG